jgi:transposase
MLAMLRIAILGGLLVMMGQQDRSEALFYYFRLEDQGPETHLLRLIEKHISFAFVREKLKASYSDTGRPSIDPELLLCILLLGYLYGITSERRLVEELRMHLAWRWFTGLGFDQEIPYHSTFSKNGHGLISLRTLSRALIHEGGGNYQLDAGSLVNALQVIASACRDMTIAEGRIRDQLGPLAQTVLAPQRDAVIVPLADAMIRASNRDGSGAVQQAGNAVESHIAAMAARMTVNLTGANGIMEKLARFGGNPRRLPRKLIHIGSYLGAIRNAADHGPDVDINNDPWEIRDATALEYVFVACSFIAATIGIERNHPPEI